MLYFGFSVMDRALRRIPRIQFRAAIETFTASRFVGEQADSPRPRCDPGLRGCLRRVEESEAFCLRTKGKETAGFVKNFGRRLRRSLSPLDDRNSVRQSQLPFRPGGGPRRWRAIIVRSCPNILLDSPCYPQYKYSIRELAGSAPYATSPLDMATFRDLWRGLPWTNSRQAVWLT